MCSEPGKYATISYVVTVILPKNEDITVARGSGWELVMFLKGAKGIPASHGMTEPNHRLAARILHAGSEFFLEQVLVNGTQTNFTGVVQVGEIPRLMLFNALVFKDGDGRLSVQYQSQLTTYRRRLTLMKSDKEVPVVVGRETEASRGKDWRLKLKVEDL